MRDFRDLEIWDEGHKLALDVYRMTSGFPKDETYGLTSQMRRSAQSIPTNIAEGCGRDTNNELIRFCVVSMGSASELEYQLLLARDLKYLNNADYDNIVGELIKLKKRLNKFIQFLKRKPFSPSTQ